LNIAGYVWAYYNAYDVVLSENVVRYLRSEQMERLHLSRHRSGHKDGNSATGTPQPS
jgi:hypothetical protein